MKKKVIAIMFFLFFTSFLSLNAQWAVTFGGSNYDYIDSIQQTDDGGYIVLGETSSFGTYGYRDIWILKLSSEGAIEWQRTYGGSNYEYARSIQQTEDGGYIVAVEAGSFGAGLVDIWVFKLSSEGDIEWQKTYGGDGSDSASSLQQTSDRGYIIAGSTEFHEEGHWDQDIWILKLNSNGDIDWQKAYGGDGSDSASSLQQTSDGGYIVAGKISGDIWILKLSSEGDIEWQKTYGGGSASSLQQTEDGGYIVADKISGDIWILKLSSAGDVEWQKTYGGGSASSLQQTEDGGYIVTGKISGDIWILKLSSAGDIEWQKTYGGGSASFIQQTDDGGYIVAGSSSGDILVLKLSPNGEIEWQKTYGGNYSSDVSHSIQQTNDGGYIVAGETKSWGAGFYDIWILKLLPNGDINPRCAFIKNLKAEVSDTDITPEDTDITPEDTDMIPEDTNITPEDTDISPQDSDANVYKLGVSSICTLTLSADGAGTTDPAPGTYTYDTGIEVTLNAIPSEGYFFSRWSGNVETNTNPLTITMDGDKSITASFWKPEWGGGSKDKPGCFIATASCGSPLHPYVSILRDFRDTYLIPNKFGRAFIKIYYKYSPFVADFIAKHKALKTVVRISLLPFIAFSFMLLHLGPAITAALLFLIFMTPVFFVWLYQKKLRFH